MIVTRNGKKPAQFGDLYLGDAFYDTDGDLSIKTSLSEGTPNAICFVGGTWTQSRWNADDEVTPVVTELKIIE